MNANDDRKDGADRDDIIAGEYVLGVLSAKDRALVQARLRTDTSFAARVTAWENNFSSLNDDYAETAPPPNILASVEKRLFSSTALSKPGLWSSLAFWRGLSFASLAVVAGLGIYNSGVFTSQPVARPLVAELSTEAGNLSLLASYDAASGTMKLTPTAAGKPEEKSLELWLVDGDNPAVSLGILPATGEGELKVPDQFRNKIKDGMILAVSLEPFGGSPTGKATGPIFAVGKAQSL